MEKRKSIFFLFYNLETKTKGPSAYSLRQAKLVGTHSLDGTHKLADPVSKITSKFCGGVPRVIGP